MLGSMYFELCALNSVLLLKLAALENKQSSKLKVERTKHKVQRPKTQDQSPVDNLWAY